MASPSVIAGLRALLALAFAALLFAQLREVPAMYDDWMRESPGATPVRWPLLVDALLLLLCVEVAIVCIWKLLTMVAADRIFRERSFRGVNAILGAIAVAWALLLGALIYAVGPLGLPAVPVVALLLMLVVTAVVGLLMVVMRALLRQATAMRTSLEAVI